MAGTKKYSVILFLAKSTVLFFRESRKLIFFIDGDSKCEKLRVTLALETTFLQKEPFIQTSNNNFQRTLYVISNFVILTTFVKSGTPYSNCLLRHTVRKSQIVSKNSIFRKSSKIVNLNFRA